MSSAGEQIPGGGEQGERLEGSLTDGGSLPGPGHEDDRSFGAGRREEAPKSAEQPEEGASGSSPSGEASGYGNTAPR